MYVNLYVGSLTEISLIISEIRLWKSEYIQPYIYEWLELRYLSTYIFPDTSVALATPPLKIGAYLWMSDHITQKTAGVMTINYDH